MQLILSNNIKTHRSVPVIIQPLVIDITEVHPQLPHILHPEVLGGSYVIAVPVSVTHRRRTRKTIIVLIGVAQHIVGGRIVRPHHYLRCPLLPPSLLPYTQPGGKLAVLIAELI